MRDSYPYALSLTSQFYFCGLPLRLDSYSFCAYRCQYCYALARGGAADANPASANADALARRIDRVAGGRVQSVIDEFIARQQPFHLGGMSDPFAPTERRNGASLRLLKVLSDRDYPTVISTKGTAFADDRYLELLKKGRFVIQVSLNSLDEQLLQAVDVGTPGASARLAAAAVAAQEGIPVTCRIQPILPTREADAFEVMSAAASVGMRHVAVEHLKLPIETSWEGTATLADVLGTDLTHRFRSVGSRIGREWILPVEERLPLTIELRNLAHSLDLSFGAADTDLLLLSDGDCCCSGVEQFPGFGGFFSCTYPEAVRRGAGRHITWSSLRDAWRPERSIAKFINSRSRLATAGRGAGITSYLEANWNGRPNGPSPLGIYGVVETGDVDAEGMRIFRLHDEALQLMAGNRTFRKRAQSRAT